MTIVLWLYVAETFVLLNCFLLGAVFVIPRSWEVCMCVCVCTSPAHVSQVVWPSNPFWGESVWITSWGVVFSMSFLRRGSLVPQGSGVFSRHGSWMGLTFSFNFHTFMTCMVSGVSLQVEEPNFGATQTVEIIFIYDVHFLPAPCSSRGCFPVLPCCDDGLPTWGAPPLAVQLWGVQGRRGSTAWWCVVMMSSEELRLAKDCEIGHVHGLVDSAAHFVSHFVFWPVSPTRPWDWVQIWSLNLWCRPCVMILRSQRGVQFDFWFHKYVYCNFLFRLFHVLLKRVLRDELLTLSIVWSSFLRGAFTKFEDRGASCRGKWRM